MDSCSQHVMWPFPVKRKLQKVCWQWILNTKRLRLIVILVWQKYAIETQGSFNWAPSSEFVSSSIPSWQILTAHAQPFRGTRDLAFCLKVPLDSLLVWASSGGSGETARMRRLAWTFAARIGDKYQIRLTRSNYFGQCNLSCVFNFKKLKEKRKEKQNHDPTFRTNYCKFLFIFFSIIAS